MFVYFWAIHFIELFTVPILQGLVLGTDVQLFHYIKIHLLPPPTPKSKYSTCSFVHSHGGSHLLNFTHSLHLLSKPSLLSSPN